MKIEIVKDDPVVVSNLILQLQERPKEFMITATALLKMELHTTKEIGEKIRWYALIADDIINNSKGLSYEENREFLSIHMSLVSEFYNRNNISLN